MTTSTAGALMVERFQLKNGLRVWVQPRPDATSVTAMLVLGVGARHETEFNNGVSHFVEHMVFVGTERWNENEIKDVITHRGGEWNGWTGLDRTTYFAQLADRDVDTTLDWLAQIVVHPTFPADKVNKEREVIFQEKFGRYGWLVNTLDRLGFGYELDRDVRRAIFPNSTLGFRVVGEDASLDRVDRATLQAYYAAHYTPQNAVLVIVGNIAAAEAAQRAAKYFEGWTAVQQQPPSSPEPSWPDSGPQQVIVRGPLPTDQEFMQIGARTVGRTQADRWALDVLADVLEEDLTKEVRYEQGLVYALSAHNTWFDDTGYFEIFTAAKRGHEAKIRQAIEAHLAQLQVAPLSAERLTQAKTALKGRWSLAMEDNVHRAEWLAEWALTGSETLPDYAAQIEAVTAADVQRVANTYFTAQRRFIGLHHPIVTVTGGAKWAGLVAALSAVIVIGRRIGRAVRA